MFLQLEMVEENLTTVLTMDMPTVFILLPLLESVGMEASQYMLRGVLRLWLPPTARIMWELELTLL